MLEGLYAFRHILIDTDLEVDDKAALELMFGHLRLKKQIEPLYLYPKITIIAGSSTAPAVKEAVANALIKDWIAEKIIPDEVKVEVIKGSPTAKQHPNDGSEILSSERLKALSEEQEDPANFSSAALEKIESFLINESGEKSAYIALREVKDLRAVCQSFPSDTKYNNVTFLGTLSFNVNNVYRNEELGCNAFIIEVLSKFDESLCYENFHSACRNNSTKAWGESFRQYLLSPSGEVLKQAADIWDEGNIVDCYRTIADPCYEGNITALLGLDANQCDELYGVFHESYQQYKANTLAPESESEFLARCKIAMGEQAGALIADLNTSAAQRFRSNFAPFYNMVFHAPQICLADIAFMGVICNPELLEKNVQAKHLEYQGTYSMLSDSSDGNTNYVVLDEDSLSMLGQSVVNTLTSVKALSNEFSERKTLLSQFPLQVSRTTESPIESLQSTHGKESSELLQSVHGNDREKVKFA